MTSPAGPDRQVGPWVDPTERARRREEAVERMIGTPPGAPLGSGVALAELLDGSAPPEQVVHTLYRTLLGRTPDPEGLLGWLDSMSRGLSGFAVASSVVASAEFARRPPAARAAATTLLRGWTARRMLG